MSGAVALGAAFVGGAAVLALELIASRWLAPAFGFTLSTWAVLIAVTLLGGSLGAWWGGAVAPAGARSRVGTLLLSAALWTAAAGMLAPALVDRLVPLHPLAGAVVATSVLILPPVFALGALLPSLAELRAASAAPGRVVGRLVGASTAGSLAGVLLAGLVLVPGLGLRASALLLAAALAGAGVPLLVPRRASGLALAGIAGATGAAWAWPGGAAGERFVRETPYGRLEVERTELGTTLRMDGIAQASFSPLAVGRGSLLERRQYVELLPFMRPLGRSALDVGLGGGLVARALSAYGIEVESVEVDPVLLAFTRGALGHTGVVHLGDGRVVLRRMERRWDFVVLDAFRGGSPPSHLLTREAFGEARERLEAGGVLCLHLIGRPGHAAVAAVARTLGEVFAERLCLRSGHGEELADVFLFASDDPLVVPPHPELAAAGWLGNEAFAPPVGAVVLTDDRNAFDVLNEDVARALRRASRRP
jgi:spermidine synthase